MATGSGKILAGLQEIFKGEDIFIDPNSIPPEEDASPDSKVKGRPKNASLQLASMTQGENSDDSDGPTLSKAELARQRQKTGYRHILRASEAAAVDHSTEKTAGLDMRLPQDSSSTGLVKGQASSHGTAFVPWALVKNYPTSFIGKANRPTAGKFFKHTAMLNSQIWDFYYLHHPGMAKRHVMLVPTQQFLHLLKRVNTALDIHLNIPNGANGQMFTLQFGLGGTPRPRYLGRATSLETFESLPKLESLTNIDTFDGVTPQARQQFEELMTDVYATRNTAAKEAEKKKRALKRIEARQKWGMATKRAQRYLGFRRPARVPLDASDEAAFGLQNLNLTDSAAQGPNIKFVCVDSETYERNQNIVTEIGIAEVDTRHLRKIPAGHGSKNWIQKIQGYHYIIKENSWAVNGRFVPNHRSHFLFGDSEWVTEQEAVEKLLVHMGAVVANTPGQSSGRVVLVGHEVCADTANLVKVDFDVEEMADIMDVVDTKHMFQHWRRERDGTRLSRVLDELQIDHRCLHNAGNDAVYTLQAMLAMAQLTYLESLDRAAGKEVQRDTKPTDQDDQDGWSSDPDNDGGDPVGLGSEGVNHRPV